MGTDCPVCGNKVNCGDHSNCHIAEYEGETQEEIISELQTLNENVCKTNELLSDIRNLLSKRFS